MESECFPCIPLNRANQQAGGRKVRGHSRGQDIQKGKG